LINNAGITKDNLLRMSEADFDKGDWCQFEICF
jgi:hypothetical protein